MEYYKAWDGKKGCNWDDREVAGIDITRPRVCTWEWAAQVEWKTRPMEEITSRIESKGLKRIKYIEKKYKNYDESY